MQHEHIGQRGTQLQPLVCVGADLRMYAVRSIEENTLSIYARVWEWV